MPDPVRLMRSSFSPYELSAGGSLLRSLFALMAVIAFAAGRGLVAAIVLMLVGVAAYAAPPLSTLLLVLAGKAEPRWTIALAALLVAGGAALASLDILRGRRRSKA